MIHAYTILVLGAGAGAPYGFPIGTELIGRICQHPLTYTIHRHGYLEDGMESVLHRSFQRDKIDTFRRDLVESGLTSIDAFLSVRPEYGEIGKASIAAALIPCEKPLALTTRPKGDWCRYLRNLMGTDYASFRQSAEKLAIVTFNYDRLFEFLFFSFLTASYGKKSALDLFNIMTIVHVYGQLGKPDFLEKDGRPFSSELTMGAIETCVSEIRIIPENVDRSDELTRAQVTIQKAEAVCFLGFGYLPKNVERLKIDELFHGSRLLGTALNLGIRERKDAEALFSGQIRLGSNTEDALDFLKNQDPFGPTTPSTFSVPAR